MFTQHFRLSTARTNITNKKHKNGNVCRGFASTCNSYQMRLRFYTFSFFCKMTNICCWGVLPDMKKRKPQQTVAKLLHSRDCEMSDEGL